MAKELIHGLADKLGVTIDEDNPLRTFNILKFDKRKSGVFDDWNYFLHGFHCRFNNCSTGQLIEVSLNFGKEFGVLDPLFFMQFLKTTPQLNPLPFNLCHDYYDGVQILERLFELGGLEKIRSVVDGDFGLVSKKR
ncbi:hypothetical protein GC194_07295 [bacterium]|nr:hypothetical protein [bacterium]